MRLYFTSCKSSQVRRISLRPSVRPSGGGGLGVCLSICTVRRFPQQRAPAALHPATVKTQHLISITVRQTFTELLPAARDFLICGRVFFFFTDVLFVGFVFREHTKKLRTLHRVFESLNFKLNLCVLKSLFKMHSRCL